MKKSQNFKKEHLVQKRNILNDIRANSMTLQELRFFSIYLSQINKDDPRTRVVRFSLSDFKTIMELESRIKIDYMKQVTDGLLCKVVNVPNERGGYTAFQLFKECVVDVDYYGEWYVEIDAHDKALPLMFDFQDRFFSYRLWNALSLKSTNQIRMYEILKQYERIGERILSVGNLKELLGISLSEYPRYNDFKIRVLDSCQKSLAENTDIKFTCAPYGKRGAGGKILFLKFNIEKNTGNKDKISMYSFIEQFTSREPRVVNEDDISPYKDRVKYLAGACENEFTDAEIAVLLGEMRRRLPPDIYSDDLSCYEYLMDKYHEMLRYNVRKKITHRFSYLKAIIEKDVYKR